MLPAGTALFYDHQLYFRNLQLKDIVARPAKLASGPQQPFDKERSMDTSTQQK